MKDLDAFLPNILMYAPGCALPTAYNAIRQAAIEFCERTRLWRFDDEFTVTAQDCDALLAPAGAVVHEIECAWFDGRKLEPASTRWLDDHREGWRTGALSGLSAYFTQTEPNTVRLVPASAGKARLAMWLKPDQDADELPDFMADQYNETIAQGALGRILLIPNQSFTNPEMAVAYGAAFQVKLDSLSTKGFTGQQRAPQRTRASFF